jgi:hypothetical protein
MEGKILLVLIFSGLERCEVSSKIKKLNFKKSVPNNSSCCHKVVVVMLANNQQITKNSEGIFCF